MKLLTFKLFAALACALALASCAASDSSPDVESVKARDEKTNAPRIVSIGGSVTEIIYALGAGENLVGVDTSSVYPQAATQLPQVGYMRQVSTEGVLSLKPNLIIAAAETGSPQVVEQLKTSGVRFVQIPQDNSLEGAKRKIEIVADALNMKEQGRRLIEKLESDVNEAQVDLKNVNSKPRVLILIARGAGSLSVSGANTAADEMVRLAGAINAVENYENYKPLTAEALVAAAPDVVLLPSRGLESIGGVEGVLGLPGMKETPAGRARRIVALDDLKLLGLSPRTGEAAKELVALLHQAKSR